MSKIIKYEIRIILLKPYVFTLLLINLLYSYYILSSEIILGVSDTAPFSGWSFGKYMGSSTLWAFILSMFILVYSRTGKKKVSILTDMSGFSPKKLNMIRSLIVAGFFLLNCILIFILGCVFLQALFGVTYIGSYVVDFLLITIPCLFILIGFGTLAGNIHPVFIYAFIVLIMAVSFISSAKIGAGGQLMYNIDTVGANYYEAVSSLMENFNASETPFVINGDYVVSRIVYAFLGIVAFVVGYVRIGRKQKYT